MFGERYVLLYATCDVVLAQAAASIPFTVLENEYKVSGTIIRKAFM